MRKYLQVFKISFQQEFVYRFNFIMWRVRNVLQIFLIFFLWDAIFSDPQKIVLGYDRTKIFTYVFALVVIRSLVLSTRSIDVAGEISRGETANYLVRPINYFKYWFTRDLSSKALNLFFALGEITLLYFLLRPSFFFQGNIVILIFFVISLVLALLLYFLLVFLSSMFPFWYPENAWGFIFLLIVTADLLGGGIFPIDVLPNNIQGILYLTPFPYLLFVPIAIYLEKFTLAFSLKSISVSFVWVVILYLLMRYLWNQGLKSYRSEGR